jgi:hypothetical protein
MANPQEINNIKSPIKRNQGQYPIPDSQSFQDPKQQIVPLVAQPATAIIVFIILL